MTTDNGGVVAHYQLRGQLGLVPVGTAGGGHVVQATLSDASLADVNFSDSDQRVPADFVAGFGKPCFITFAPNGAVTELRVAPGLPSFAQTTWKVIAGVMQTSAPAKLGQSSWRAREFDAAGEYSVQYEVLVEHSIKHELPYFGPAGPLSASQQIAVSDADFAFGGGVVDTLSVHERVRATPATPWPAMTFGGHLQARSRLERASPSERLARRLRCGHAHQTARPSNARFSPCRLRPRPRSQRRLR